MFTGIVLELGKIEAVTARGGSMRLRISSKSVRDDAVEGDSVSVNGVCLTVNALGANWFEMDVGEETYRRTTLSSLGHGAEVNLEPALKIGSRLGGHIVSGHVDAVAAVRSVNRRTTQIDMTFELPADMRQLVARKGSIAIDGVSLTVGDADESSFSVYLIPHTVENTTLKNLRAGGGVNLEADVLARYVCNALKHKDGGGKLENLLKDFGYIKGAE